jgi:hypothetical protein
MCGLSQLTPYIYREMGTGEPIEGDKIVEFRLLYSGRMVGSSKTNTRASDKHEIRREFHPQLRRLWATNQNLKMVSRFSASGLEELEEKLKSETFKDEDAIAAGINAISNNWQRAGFRFVPLITEELCLRCSVDILLLRPEDDHRIIMQGGDIDARLKTLFDALRIPKNKDETGGASPQIGEDPFYCLLEDDGLISEVRVTTDQLLLLPKEYSTTPNDVFAVISVKLQPTHQGRFSFAFS